MGATNRRLAGFFTTTNLIDFAHRRYRNLIAQVFRIVRGNIQDIKGFSTAKKPVLDGINQELLKNRFIYNKWAFELQLALLPLSPTIIKGAQNKGCA